MHFGAVFTVDEIYEPFIDEAVGDVDASIAIALVIQWAEYVVNLFTRQEVHCHTQSCSVRHPLAHRSLWSFWQMGQRQLPAYHTRPV